MNRKLIHAPYILSFILLSVFFAFACTAISKATPTASVSLQANILNIAEVQPSQTKVEPHAPSQVMIGVTDTVLSKTTADFIRAYHIGGILLLSRNIQSLAQLKKLTADIHAINSEIIIAIDQEGGDVSRIAFPGTESTAQKDISSETDAYLIARKRAEQLREYGIDMNFSPVVDYITNPDSFLYNRTFQKDPEIITMLAGAMLRGYEDGGVIPVLKHFPGHTDDSVDTHDSIATVPASKQELEKHLVPFKKIISRFNPPAVMIGGSVYAAFDSLPAALSPTIIQSLLQNELGFKGMAISDDLEMDAFSQFSLKDRALRALEAGCNIIIFSQTKTTQKELGLVLQELTRSELWQPAGR
ncbi:hypothetical protein A2755_03375 [Candidatus Wolfebacteria bacterium RIFCSPHIGHO2_01_FULL_48_22]|uniref:beta-N-acetylhexosaminidase n=2 Tax=Candidatus Wolfeibacteriota TaxID=1752735 RepID=A0A1F8DRW7_9BACT|nr:MAG: hypothetical protein A2755_03375 [Candidatus Wolfebacteria bacterium RIFCSPHIGHO2_01_FULL_48_22]OGM92068.1 MAG: hypothetical protein A2935_01865 [Candidatus Wolfebacteria bacterium RIFCSPLOWO2_01_FULL_47_17b]